MFNLNPISAGTGDGSLLPSIHGGGDGGAGLIGILDSLLTVIAGLLESGSSWNPIAGMEVMGANIHPMIVHFPIAFLSAFLLVEIAGMVAGKPAWRQTASVLLYLGAFGAVAAVAAGLIAEALVPHGREVHDILELHELLGITLAIIAVGLAVWRTLGGWHCATSMAQALRGLLMAMLAVFLLLGADLGGLMVYRYGVGVVIVQPGDEHSHGQGDRMNKRREEGDAGAPASGGDPGA